MAGRAAKLRGLSARNGFHQSPHSLPAAAAAGGQGTASGGHWSTGGDRRTQQATKKKHSSHPSSDLVTHPSKISDLSHCGEMPCYYDVDDILMEEPISAVFQVIANGVGLLDPGAERNSVEKSAKVDLPFWLAHGMLSLEQAVSINVPPCFTQNMLEFTYKRCLKVIQCCRTRKEIQADAACVDLRIRCPYFYELGCKIVPLVSDKSIGQFLRYAFTSRYKEILSKSHSSSTTTVPKFAPRLTKEEARGTAADFSLRVRFCQGIDDRFQEMACRGREAAEGVYPRQEEEDEAS